MEHPLWEILEPALCLATSCLQGYSWCVQFLLPFCHVSLWVHFQFSCHYALGIKESKPVPLLAHQALTLHMLLYLLLSFTHTVPESLCHVKGPRGRQATRPAIPVVCGVRKHYTESCLFRIPWIHIEQQAWQIKCSLYCLLSWITLSLFLFN